MVRCCVIAHEFETRNWTQVHHDEDIRWGVPIEIVESVIVRRRTITRCDPCFLEEFMATFKEMLDEAPEIGYVWRHPGIEGLDCLSGSFDTEEITRGPFLYTSRDGWKLMEARFVDTHQRGNAGILEWRMMRKGTNVATSSSLELAYDSSLKFLARLLSESSAGKDTKDRTEREIKFELEEKYRNMLNTASSSSSNVDSVEFRIFARGLGILYGSRSRVTGYLEVVERFIGTPESTESQLKGVVTTAVQRHLG